MKKYCCGDMRGAVEWWGGIFWDKEKQHWEIERDLGGDIRVDVIEFCPWCKKQLEPESEE